jgi:hypothetical protein
MNSLFRHWFRVTSASFRRRAARVSPRRLHLGLEHLEDRLVPATFNVNNLTDMLNPGNGIMTLRSAIQMANQTPGSNTINLTLAGTYLITLPPTGAHDNAGGAFTIIPNAASPARTMLTIQNMSGGKVVVDGNHLDRVFDINPSNGLLANAPFTVVLQGFTVQNGIAQPGDAAQGSGGGIRDQANVNLTLTNMIVTNNIATADGGGIAMENPTVSTFWTLTLNNSTITNNHAGDAGGGVETDGSGNDLINPGTVITGNTCVNQGGGIWLDAIQVNDTFQGASLTVNGATISGNQALSAGGGLGGGIGNAGNGQINISNSTVANNFAGMNGGGFGDENAQGVLTVQNSSFLNNTTIGIGGGIASGGPVTISNSTLANNFAGTTGGGFGDENAQDMLTVQNSTFFNNAAAVAGGGIATAGTLTSITSCEIDGNTSGGTGGGLFTNGVQLTLQSSTLANNTASDNGGGIELATTGAGAFQGSTITNTTLTGNTALNNAGANGGGLDAGADFTGDVLLLNDTINANFASMGGGIFWAATMGSTFRLQNTIVAGNFAAAGPDVAANMLFTAALDGNQQVPPVDTQGTGATSVVLSPDQTTLSFSLTFANLSGAPTAAHLHNAPAGENGPIATDANGANIELQNLPNDPNGTVGPQTFTVNATFVAQLVQGNIYANVHTAKFPEGEIRGQLALANGAFTDLGGNLIGVSGPGSGNIGFTSAATQTGTVGSPLNPQLGPLQDNGGPTIGAPGHTMTLQTELLLPDSPAIGKGLVPGAPATDERGFPSGVPNAINVGATSSAIAPPGGSSAAPPSAWDGSLDDLAVLLFELGTDKKDV